MRQQFRFASEGQSRSSRLLAERSQVCKHRLCRFGSNAVVMSRAAGSDDFHKSTRSAITAVPLCLCERQPRPISAGLNETVGWPAKQAPGMT